MKEVIAGIILNNNNDILIARRGKNEKQAGMWEFPGGKVEPGETYQQCLKREIKEELDLEIEVGELLGENIFIYPNGKIKLIAYFAKLINGNIKLSVHDKFEWIDIEYIDKYNFAPADIPLVKKLKEVRCYV